MSTDSSRPTHRPSGPRSLVHRVNTVAEVLGREDYVGPGAEMVPVTRS